MALYVSHAAYFTPIPLGQEGNACPSGGTMPEQLFYIWSGKEKSWWKSEASLNSMGWRGKLLSLCAADFAAK